MGARRGGGGPDSSQQVLSLEGRPAGQAGVNREVWAGAHLKGGGSSGVVSVSGRVLSDIWARRVWGHGWNGTPFPVMLASCQVRAC